MIQIPGKDRKQQCSFCLEDDSKARPLVAGPNNVFICGNCISLAASMLCGHFNEIAERLARPTESPPTQET